MKKLSMMVAAAFAVMAATAAPAVAQGKSGQHGGGHGNPHAQQTEVVRGSGSADVHVNHGRGHGDTDVRVNGTARTTHSTRTVRTTRTKSTPPGWCQGRGNPHNTAASCGYRTDRIYRDRNGVWRDRYGNRLRDGYIYRDRSGSVRDWLGRILG